MILVLAPSPSLDATLEVDALVPGEIARPTRVTRVAGGKALNVARVATALGADVHALTALGGPTCTWIRALLDADDVAATTVPLAATTRMCSAIVAGEATSSTDLYEPAAPFTASEWHAFRDAAVTLVHDARPAWVALSGSLPEGIAPSAMAMLLEQLGEASRIVVDGSGAGLRATVDVADLVKINLAEAAALLDEAPADAAEACARMRERFGVDAIVTDGIRGGSALVGGRTVRIPRPARLGRFPAGSGDAFLGGLLAALERDASLEGAIAEAAEASVRNALVPGQGVLGPSET